MLEILMDCLSPRVSLKTFTRAALEELRPWKSAANKLRA